MIRSGSTPGLRWIFLDVGNVLLDEDPLTFLVFRRHVEAIRRVRPDRSFAGLLAEREARASAGARWPLHEVTAAYLDETDVALTWDAADREVRARYAELSPPIPGALELVDRLARRARLGLIANQPRQCRDRLADLGLLEPFQVVLLSEEEGLYKPDPRLFRRALDRAGARPAESLMVGDRLDHDLEPAARLGLATAWVRWPRRSAKGGLPDDPEATAYLESLERAAARLASSATPTFPSIVVDEIAELDASLIGWTETDLSRDR